MMQPTAEQTKTASTKAKIAMPAPAMGPLMLHQFKKLPAMSILFAKVKIHAKAHTRFKTVKNELKNKSIVFIFLRVLCSHGAAVLIICIVVCISIMHGMAAF
jgi:hypothetical protein